MTDQEGFYKFHRRALRHPLLKKADALAVWTRLVGEARFSSYREVRAGQKIELERGQLTLSVREWCRDMGIAHKRMRGILGTFVRHGMVKLDTAPANAATIVTVCNYVFYQGSLEEAEPLKGTARAQVGHRRGTLYNKKSLPLADANGPEPATEPGQIEPVQAAQPLTAKKLLWQEMTAAVVASGQPEKAARAEIGRWFKTWEAGDVFSAHFAAQQKDPADYLSYVRGILNKRPHKVAMIPADQATSPPRPPSGGGHRDPTMELWRKAEVEAEAQGIDPRTKEGRAEAYKIYERMINGQNGQENAHADRRTVQAA